MTKGNRCGNINELRQEGLCERKKMKKVQKKGLTKALGCDKIDRLSLEESRRKDPQRRAPKKQRSQKMRRCRNFLGRGASAEKGEGHGSERAKRRVATRCLKSTQ